MYGKYIYDSIPFFRKWIFGIDNKIGSEGMKYLSESLKSNNSIQTLDLACKTKTKNQN